MPKCLVKSTVKELNMKHAVQNRATICVADRTDVSGRVTADEVNLDRFHKRIHKVCALVAARSKVYLSATTMILIVTLVVPATAQITFDGAFQGYEKGTPQPQNTQSALGTVTGFVSNLGQVSLTYNTTINLMNRTGTGSGVLLIGKNGDSVFITQISGTFYSPTAGSPPPSVPIIRETYTIKGGTGRFQGAAGQFMVERLVDFVDTAMDFNFTAGVIVSGTIALPSPST